MTICESEKLFDAAQRETPESLLAKLRKPNSAKKLEQSSDDMVVYREKLLSEKRQGK